MSSLDLTNFTKVGKKIICSGINYREFASKIGVKLPSEPVIFLKPTTAYIVEGENIQIPQGARDVLCEVELGVVIGKTAKSVPESQAMDYIGGYCIALDLADGDLLSKLKVNLLPIALAKSFDTACPVSALIPKRKFADPHTIDIWLKVNGEFRQNSSTNDMIFSIPYLISWISRNITLEAGDVILTGGPPGMGPVKGGDVIECGLGDMKMSFFVNRVSML